MSKFEKDTKTYVTKVWHTLTDNYDPKVCSTYHGSENGVDVRPFVDDKILTLIVAILRRKRVLRPDSFLNTSN